MENNQHWALHKGMLLLRGNSPQFEKLDNVVYHVGFNPDYGFFLTKMDDMFTFDYKIYGLETKFIERVQRYYAATDGNLGILMNGLKGTGKTVTGKILSAKSNQPVIIVDSPYKGLNHFLNSIPQDITIFIDEYEKIFKDDYKSDMLTIMDGAYTSPHRRLFILTTNYLKIDENLLERPSRIRYLKKFTDLNTQIITEVVDDCLIEKEFRDVTIDFISKLKKITIDIVKAIVNEVNIHCESPFEFAEVFNIELNDSKFKGYLLDDDGNEKLLFNNEEINYRDLSFDRTCVRDSFRIGNIWCGNISKVFSPNTIEVMTNSGQAIKLRLEKCFSTHNSFQYETQYNKPFIDKDFLTNYALTDEYGVPL